MPAPRARPSVAAAPAARFVRPDAPPTLARRAGASAIALRPTFYQQHLVAAQYFADAAHEAAERGIGCAGTGAMRRHHDLVAASVLATAAFLEGSVNALVVELQEGGLTTGRRHARHLNAQLTRAWNTHERSPTLNKYQLLLSLWDADSFHPRRSPYVEVARLMRWRDVLVHRAGGPPQRDPCHPAPRLPPDVARPRATAATQRRTRRMRLNAECAQWAVQAAITFSSEFCRRMSLRGRGFGDASG
jgi:hypothetical protein